MSLNVGKELRKANKLVATGDLDLAREVIIAILKTYPKSKPALAALDNIAKGVTELGAHEAETIRIAKFLSQGDYKEVVKEGDKLLVETPNSPDILCLVGEAYYKIGDLAKAVPYFEKAVNSDPNCAPAFNNLGIIFCDSSQFQKSIFSFENAIRISPRNPHFHLNMGIALQEVGQLDQSASCYKKAIALDDKLMGPRNNLAVIYKEQGKFRKAISILVETIELAPEYVDAYNNLGMVYNQTSQYKNALEILGKAIKLDSNHSDAYLNMGIALTGENRYLEALQCYANAIRLRPDFNEALSRYSDLICSLTINFQEYSTNWGDAYLNLLTTKNLVKPSSISKQIVSLLKLHPSIGPLLQDGKLPELSQTKKICEELEKIPLLLRLMELAPIPDLEFERFLKVLRYNLLQMVTNSSESIGCSELMVSLAKQCFVNEYVYGENPAEGKLIFRLEKELGDQFNINSGHRAEKIVCLASYRPLYKYSWLSKIEDNAALSQLLELQVTEPKNEYEIQAGISRLGEIQESSSVLVKKQYEENPYPRWIHTNLKFKPLTVRKLAESLDLRLQAPIKENATSEILIAGCGTGQHSIHSSLRFGKCNVKAIDLSASSLSYAIRKTRELGIDNIEYYQADILELDFSEERFDVVESVGVLHHLAEPMRGWSKLRDCLKPNGLMKVGLYSSLARSAVNTARELVSTREIGITREEILEFRNSVLFSDVEDALQVKSLSSWLDMYSTSEVRDLLFNVQEHQYTLIEIAECLEKLGFKFCGFEFPNTMTKNSFRAEYPDPNSFFDLNSWHNFEAQNPNTFAAMYQFWIQKI